MSREVHKFGYRARGYGEEELTNCCQILLTDMYQQVSHSARCNQVLSSRKVLVLEDQFTNPCPCPRALSPCP